MDEVRTIFMGTPDFAVPILERLAQSPIFKNAGFNIVGVVTAQDRPAGRGQKIHASAVKTKAQALGLNVIESVKINSVDEISLIKQLKPDLILLVAFGQIIPKAILKLPKFEMLGIHPSLLPCWRGASPIQAVILNGEEKTGVTIFVMDEKLDHGPIIVQESFEIWPDANCPALSERLSNLSADLIEKILPQWVAGEVNPEPQDEAKATYVQTLTKESGRLVWIKPADELERQIRAYFPWPSSWFEYQIGSKVIKIKVLEAGVYGEAVSHKPGTSFITKDNLLAIWTSKGALVLKKVQPEGKQEMSGHDFIAGRPEFVKQKIL
jgi:methionyl-tRNA formyltransferase